MQKNNIKQKSKLIILDRDGVINRELGHYVETPDEFHLIDDVGAAIALLKRAGYTIAVATNQAGVAKGRYSHLQLASIHHKMVREIRAADGDIDRIVYCPSADNNHPWRKPNAGMLTEILNRYQDIDTPVYFIGDSIRDLQAAIAAGCCPILLKTGKGSSQQQQLTGDLAMQTQIFDNLVSASHSLIQQDNN